MKRSESFESLKKNKLTENEIDLSSEGEDINSESDDEITFPPEDNSKESAAAKLRKSLKVEQEALGNRIKSCGFMFSTKLEEYGMRGYRS